MKKIKAPLPATQGEKPVGQAISTCLVHRAAHINQVRLLNELQTFPTSKRLPSYNDLVRVERSYQPLKRLIKRLLRSCLGYINFLHESSEKDTHTPFKINQLCVRVSKFRTQFLKVFLRCVEQIRRYDDKRSELWAKALRSPDLTATKVAISALNPGSYQNLIRWYGFQS